MEVKTNTCPRAGKWFGGCKFSPRYDKSEPPNWAGNYRGAVGPLVEIIEAAKAATYVRDVCVRCGKSIERAR